MHKKNKNENGEILIRNYTKKDKNEIDEINWKTGSGR